MQMDVRLIPQSVIGGWRKTVFACSTSEMTTTESIFPKLPTSHLIDDLLDA